MSGCSFGSPGRICDGLILGAEVSVRSGHAIIGPTRRRGLLGLAGRTWALAVEISAIQAKKAARQPRLFHSCNNIEKTLLGHLRQKFGATELVRGAGPPEPIHQHGPLRPYRIFRATGLQCFHEERPVLRNLAAGATDCTRIGGTVYHENSETGSPVCERTTIRPRSGGFVAIRRKHLRDMAKRPQRLPGGRPGIRPGADPCLAGRAEDRAGGDFEHPWPQRPHCRQWRP